MRRAGDELALFGAASASRDSGPPSAYMPSVKQNIGTHYLRREFAYTNFEQKYSLPDNVDEQAISAKVEDGILTIELPKIKREEGKTSRQIAIK